MMMRDVLNCEEDRNFSRNKYVSDTVTSSVRQSMNRQLLNHVCNNMIGKHFQWNIPASDYHTQLFIPLSLILKN